MTIGTTQPRVAFACNGASITFPIPIQGYNAADFTVIRSDSIPLGGASQVLTLNSDYTLVPNSSDVPPKWSMTMNLAYPVGTTLQVFINPAQTQQSNYVDGRAFPSQAVLQNFDQLTLMVQRLQDEVNRCIRLPDGDTSVVGTLLANSTNRILTNLGFDANGNTSLFQTLAAGVLSAAAIGGFLWPVLGSEGATVTAPYYFYGDPMRYGGVGNGTPLGGADDTLPLQFAINANVGEVPINIGRTFRGSIVTVTHSVRIKGYGTLIQSSNHGVSFITAPAQSAGGATVNLELEGITLDGNQVNQGALPSNFTVDFRSVGTATNPTLFRATGVVFQNAAVGDLRLFSDQVGGLIKAVVTGGCRFLGGITGDGGGYGPRCIDVADNVEVLISGNQFDFLRSPGGGIAGKAGIVTYFNQAEGVPAPGPPFTAWVKTIITGNDFNNLGRDQAATQGPIDCYGYAVDVEIANNTIRNFAGRGICVKGSDPRVVIHGNEVDTSAAGVAQASTGIICNPSTQTDFYNDIIISDNIVNNVSGYGILVSGLNVTSTAGTRQGVQIRGNIIRGAGSAGGATADIYLQACRNVDVVDNHCFGNLGNSASIGGAVNTGFISIRGNQLVSPAGRCILFNSADNNSLAFLEIDGNLFFAPGLNAVGQAAYLSNIGGCNWGSKNRLVGMTNATPIFRDQSCSIASGTIAAGVLTVTAITSGVLAPGQVLYAASGLTQVSIAGTTISSQLTGTTGGIGTYQLTSPGGGTVANIPGAQAFLTQGSQLGTLSPPAVLTTHSIVKGMVTLYQDTHAIDNAGGAGAGDLAWLNGGVPGKEYTLYLNNPAHVVTFKDNAGALANGNLNIGADWVPGSGLAAGKCMIKLLCRATDFILIAKT